MSTFCPNSSSLQISLQEQLPPLPSQKGVFDSFKADIIDGCARISFLHRHFNRFKKGCLDCFSSENQLSFFSYDDLLKAIALTMTLPKAKSLLPGSASIRFRIWHGQNTLQLNAAPFVNRYQENFLAHLYTYPICRQLNFKNTPADESLTSYRLALNAKGTEGLLLDDQENITEASWSNFFWIDSDEKIHTTADGLQGITREIIYQLYGKQILAAKIKKSTLLKERYASFITNALHGVIPVGTVDGTQMRASSLVDTIQQCYNRYYYSNNEVTWIPANSWR